MVADQTVELAGGRCEYVAEGAQVGVGVAEHGAVQQRSAFDTFAFDAFLHGAAGVHGDVVYVDRQLGVSAQAFDHPVEGDVGEVAVGVGAAYVGVHAGEPDLLDYLPRRERLAYGFFP